MKWVWLISLGMTVAGFALTIVGQLLDLTPVVSLAGLLFVVAGVVKLIIAWIWSGMFSEPVPGDRVIRSETKLK